MPNSTLFTDIRSIYQRKRLGCRMETIGKKKADDRGYKDVGKSFSSPSPSLLLTKKQLAEHLSISIRSIDNFMNNEGLPFYKMGRSVRFRLDDVAAWMQKRKYP